MRTDNRKRPWSSGPWQAPLSQSCPPAARRGWLLPREVRVRTVGKPPSPQARGSHRGLQAWSLPAAAALRKMRMRSSTSGRYSSAKGQVPRTLRPEQLPDAGLWSCLGTAPSSIPLGGARSPDTGPWEVRDPNELPSEFLSALSFPAQGSAFPMSVYSVTRLQGKMRSQCQTYWHQGINLITFKQKKVWLLHTPALSSRGSALSVRRKPKSQFPSQAARQCLRRPLSPEDICLQCSALSGSLALPGYLGPSLLPIRQASSPEPPPSFSLAATALALIPGHSESASGTGPQSGR